MSPHLSLFTLPLSSHLIISDSNQGFLTKVDWIAHLFACCSPVDVPACHKTTECYETPECHETPECYETLHARRRSALCPDRQDPSPLASSPPTHLILAHPLQICPPPDTRSLPRPVCLSNPVCRLASSVSPCGSWSTQSTWLYPTRVSCAAHSAGARPYTTAQSVPYSSRSPPLTYAGRNVENCYNPSCCCCCSSVTLGHVGNRSGITTQPPF